MTGKRPFGHHGGFGMPVEKPTDFKGTFFKLLLYLKPYGLRILLVLMMAVLSTLFSIVSPKILGQATTLLFEGSVIDFVAIWRIIRILACLYLLSSFFGFVQQYWMAAVSQQTVFDMRQHISEKLARLPLKYFDSKTHGEIMSRVTNDIDTIGSTLQQSLTQIIMAICTLVGVIVMMFTISPFLTLITICTIPFSILGTVLIARFSQVHFKNQQKELGELNGHVEEMLTGHKIVKAFGQEADAVDAFEAINDRLFQSASKAQFISGLIMPMMQFVTNVGYVIVCVVGGVLVTRKAIAIGDIQAFIQYSRQFARPIAQTAGIAGILQSTIAAAERVFEILEAPEEVPDNPHTEPLQSVKGAVSFEKVRFGYQEGMVLFDHLDLSVKSGQTIAIVGPTGAGKTTLVNLLMRFYDPQAGIIRVDNRDIQALQRGHLRQLFGMVLQDTWLFNGTIQDNIAYGSESSVRADVIKAAETVHADHFIRTLPNGYDTILNEDVSNISQGQKQLLTIARAVLIDPAILILDEATSNVDTRTEMVIQKAMQALMQGRTSFVIAHRLSTIREADRILVMDKGAILETGTHAELMDRRGFYADLYYSQFTGTSLEM